MFCNHLIAMDLWGICSAKLSIQKQMKKGNGTMMTTLEFDLDLVLLWFDIDDLSFDCFLAVPDTTSKIVGRSLIILNSLLLQLEKK